MKTSLLIKLPVIPAMVLLSIYFNGCSSDKKDADLSKFREEVKREDRLTSKVMEDNLDEDLNPTEQRAVREIFEKNERAKERMVDDVFQDQKDQKK